MVRRSQILKMYISGPITGKENGNREAFSEIAKHVEYFGNVAVNPHEIEVVCVGISCVPTGETAHRWECYMRNCLREMVMCDGIIQLDGWRDSAGAALEFRVAADLGLIIIPVNRVPKGSS